MNKTILFVVIATICIGLAFWYFSSDEKITNLPPKGNVIVAFGDSLVEGVGGKEGGFVSILSQKIGEPIVNMGVSGNTTRDGLARVDNVVSLDPKIVILLLGGNDFLRKVPRVETFNNLEQIIDRLHSSGALVILLGVQGGIFSDGYDEYFEDLASKKGTIYVPNVLSGLLTKPELMYDAIHPNDLGYQKIAIKVLPALQKALGK